MSYLTLTLPGGQTINAPNSIPQGGLTYLTTVIRNALTLMLVLAVILVVIFIVWAGMQWSSSGGDKAKLAAARARLTWAIIGLVIALGSFFIINIFGYFFHLNLLGF